MLDDFLLFVEVARRGSYAKTAHDLKITAPTLSKRIQSLEDQLGDSLFIRSSRGVKLTSFGKGLFDKLGEMTLDLQSAISESSEQESVSFVLHCPQNLMTGLLYPAIEKFVLEKQQVNMVIEPANNNVLLSQTSFDLAVRIGKQKDSSFYQKRIADVAVCLVARKDSNNKGRLLIPYSDSQLQGSKLSQIDKVYAQKNFVNDITLVRKLVASGAGVGLLPMTEISELCDGLPGQIQYQSDILFTRPVYALWANKPKPTLLAASLIRSIEECVENTSALQGKMIAME
ncbi:LysR family transcriptional regulator [Vibrio sp. WJH972]